MTATPPLNASPMTEDALQQIFSSDQDMYPAPLTYARLESWVTASPDLSRCFHLRNSSKEGEESEMASIAGVLMVLPLKEAHWRDLLVGHLRETDIDAASMIAPDDAGGCAVGLHVFHVERLSGNARAFTKLSVAYADSVARTKGWHVLGYSGKSFVFLSQVYCSLSPWPPLTVQSFS
ncbi:hypothetical protein BJ166DRAFT_371017 [Pestalotiopsis sp. NC0098]|nr:hypothetical protein BJ166DRAFT_371017 [Pestalotiopsis sp. NC0098]